MSRSKLLRTACLAWLLCGAAVARAQAPPSLAFVGFELVDEQPSVSHPEVLARRLEMIDQQFRQALAEQGLYKVVDRAPARELIDKLRAQQEFVYRCNGCLADIGKKLGVPLVAAGWVQKVSNLILNINVEVRDAAANRLVLSKSVDLRGNTDETWSRGIAYMVRDMVEKRKQNAGYGR